MAGFLSSAFMLSRPYNQPVHHHNQPVHPHKPNTLHAAKHAPHKKGHNEKVLGHLHYEHNIVGNDFGYSHDGRISFLNSDDETEKENLNNETSINLNKYDCVSPFDVEWKLRTKKKAKMQKSRSPKARGFQSYSPWCKKFAWKCQVSFYEFEDPQEFKSYSPFHPKFVSKFSSPGMYDSVYKARRERRERLAAVSNKRKSEDKAQLISDPMSPQDSNKIHLVQNDWKIFPSIKQKEIVAQESNLEYNGWSMDEARELHEHSNVDKRHILMKHGHLHHGHHISTPYYLGQYKSIEDNMNYIDSNPYNHHHHHAHHTKGKPHHIDHRGHHAEKYHHLTSHQKQLNRFWDQVFSPIDKSIDDKNNSDVFSPQIKSPTSVPFPALTSFLPKKNFLPTNQVNNASNSSQSYKTSNYSNYLAPPSINTSSLTSDFFYRTSSK